MPQSSSNKILEAPIHLLPFPHIIIPNFLDAKNLKTNIQFDQYRKDMLALVERFGTYIDQSKSYKVTDGRLMVRYPGYELQPHLDSAHFAITCLYYIGGGGQLCLYKTHRPSLQDAESSTIYFRESDCVLTNTIPTAPNTFVAFVNTPNALHGAPKHDEHRYIYQCHIMEAK